MYIYLTGSHGLLQFGPFACERDAGIALDYLALLASGKIPTQRQVNAPDFDGMATLNNVGLNARWIPTV